MRSIDYPYILTRTLIRIVMYILFKCPLVVEMIFLLGRRNRFFNVGCFFSKIVPFGLCVDLSSGKGKTVFLLAEKLVIYEVKSTDTIKRLNFLMRPVMISVYYLYKVHKFKF